MLQRLVLVSSMLVLAACPNAKPSASTPTHASNEVAKDPKTADRASVPVPEPPPTPTTPEAAPSAPMDQAPGDTKGQSGEKAETGQQKAASAVQEFTPISDARERAGGVQLARRHDLLELWLQLPEASRPPFPDALMAQWSPTSRLPLIRFVVHSHLLGVDVIPRLASLAHRVSGIQQGRVAAFFAAELKHHPDDLFELLSVATGQFRAGYSAVFEQVELGNQTHMHRLCFLAQYHRRTSLGDFSNPACTLDYADVLRRSPNFADELYGRPSLFAAVVQDIDTRPRSQRSWWLTTAYDRELLQGWFAAPSTPSWDLLATQALLIAPYVMIGDKSRTLRALAKLSHAQVTVVQAIGYLDRIGPQPEPFRMSDVLKVLGAVPHELRETAFEHVMTMRDWLQARVQGHGGVMPEMELASALEVFGTLPTALDMDVLQGHLRAFLSGEHSPVDAPSHINRITQLLADTQPEIRVATLEATLFSFAYADRQCKAATDETRPVPAYAMDARFERLRGVLRCAESGNLEQAQRFLLELEGGAHRIIPCPPRCEAQGDYLTHLIRTLGQIAPERYADLKTAAGLLMGEDPERNISHLIDLGACRKVHPQLIADELSQIFAALHRHARDGEINPSTSTQLTTSLCRAHADGAPDGRARGAVEHIEAGSEWVSILQYIEPPPSSRRSHYIRRYGKPSSMRSIAVGEARPPQFAAPRW